MLNRLHFMVIIILSIILLLVMIFQVSVAFAASPTEKHILILHAFTPDYPAHEQYNKGLQNILGQDSQYKFSYSYEYFDLARFPDKESYFEDLAQYLKLKYSNYQPDYIIISNDLYPLILKYGEDLFPGVPVIIAWNEDNLPLTTMPPNYIAITQSIEIEKNIQLILETLPSTEKIYIVIGDSVDERNKVKGINEAMNKYSDKVEFVLLNKLPYEQMLEQIRNIEEHSVVLFFQWFLDVDGKSFIPVQVIEILIHEAKVPVFGVGNQYLGSGIVGGYLNNFELNGENAGKEILKILTEKELPDYQVVSAESSELIFDWRALKLWGIDEQQLPNGSKFEFREIGVWEQYGGYIVGTFILLLLQTFLIFRFLININRRKRAENELIQINSSLQTMTEKLTNLDRLKDEFLVNTSHELRTPLNGIINLTQSVLEEDAGNLTNTQKESLKIIQLAGNRLYSLINHILDISKIEQGEIKLDLRPVNLSTVISVVIHILEFQVEGKDVYLCNEIPKDFPNVLADEERLGQIFYNLIGNVVKFTEKGHVTVSAELKKESVEISIRDTGIGMSEEKLEYTFEPFTQIYSDSTRGYEGTVLGLSLMQKLVELHGGRISVHSELQKGSNFIFTIPVTIEQVERNNLQLQTKVLTYPASQGIMEAASIDMEGSNGLSILVADDDSTNLRAITTLLALEGYSIKGVTCGQAVLESLNNGNKFDLLILDIMMPGMTGFEVLKTLRKRYSYVDLPVMFLTARERNVDLEVGFNLGANDFLKKPFEFGELRARVKTLVQLRALVSDKVTSELLFLQAQIKPHFIFNALSVISSLCIKEPEKAKKLVLDLSDYLRGSFDFESIEGLTTLKKELDLVKAYIAIEQARFKKRLIVEFAIDGNVDCTIPILSIQPLVENAVRHGIMPLIEGGKINITVRNMGNFVKVSVSDNGVGIDMEKVKDLLSGEVKKGSIGLKNIHRRLVMQYGKGLEVTGVPEKGTIVEFAIPDTYLCSEGE